MRALIQRVSKASVVVDNTVVSTIKNGICVLLGICREDTFADVEYIARKLLNLRLFDDDHGKRWAKSVKDKNFDILCVSQFTLHAVLKGNKPDFHQSMDGTISKPLFDSCINLLEQGYNAEKIKTGVFGAMMQVEITNDGPVTISLDSSHIEFKQKNGKVSRGPTQTTAQSREMKDGNTSQEKEETRIVNDHESGNTFVDHWNERLQACATILGAQISFPIESVLTTLKAMAADYDADLLGKSDEEHALVDQWIYYGIERFDENAKDFPSMKEIDDYLSSRVFFVGHNLTIVDIFVFVCLHQRVSLFTLLEKENLLNLLRWFAWVQKSFHTTLSPVVFQRSLLY